MNQEEMKERTKQFALELLNSPNLYQEPGQQTYSAGSYYDPALP